MAMAPKARRHCRWRIAATAVVAVALVAACGSGGSKKGAPPPAKNGIEGVPEVGAEVPFRATVAWANNTYHEIGDGTACNVPQKDQNCRKLTPVPVLGPGGSGQLGRLRSVVAGDSHTLVLQPDRTVLSWGWNGEGQLGIGTFNLG